MNEMRKVSSEEERSRIAEKIKSAFESLTPEEKQAVKAEFLAMWEQEAKGWKEALKNIQSEIRMEKIEKYISFASISQEYFGKSKSWLYQRIRGNKVNGKPARFTGEERRRLASALEDISKKIHETAITIC